jgi:hypothetical protein
MILDVDASSSLSAFKEANAYISIYASAYPEGQIRY